MTTEIITKAREHREYANVDAFANVATKHWNFQEFNSFVAQKQFLFAKFVRESSLYAPFCLRTSREKRNLS